MALRSLYLLIILANIINSELFIDSHLFRIIEQVPGSVIPKTIWQLSEEEMEKLIKINPSLNGTGYHRLNGSIGSVIPQKIWKKLNVELSTIGKDPTEIEIPLKNKKTSQTGTYIYYVSEFAIDGQLLTCAVACNPCNKGVGHGWWEVDLGKPRTITRLEIYSCHTQHLAKMLTQITIEISDYGKVNWDTFKKCADYNSVDNPGLNSMIDIKCDQPINGRYVILIRQKIAIYRAESIAIAEVKIFEISSLKLLPEQEPTIDPRIFTIKIEIGEWMKVNTANATASQVGTKYDNDAGRAIDGNPTTVIYSISKSNEQPAWWKIELDNIYHIVSVIVTSSSDSINSNLLQEIVVEVGMDKSIRKCSRYRNIADIPRGTKIYLICNTPLLGNIVIVSRSPNSRLKPNMLSFAEIEIYANVKLPILPTGRPYTNEIPKITEPSHPNLPTEATTLPVSDIEATIKSELEKNNWFIIELSEQIMYHSGSKYNHGPYLAVDGDPSTFTVICNPCDKPVTNLEAAWMKIEFTTIFQISAVALTSSPSFESDTLQDFVIFVGFGQETDPKCAEYKHEGTIHPGTRITVLCLNSTRGNVLTIERMSDSNYKKELMAIAEIVIYAAKVEEDISIKIIINTKVTEGIWTGVPLKRDQNIKPNEITCQFCGYYLLLNETVVIFLDQRMSVVAIQLHYSANCDVEVLVGDAVETGHVCSRFEKSNDKNNAMHMSILCDQPYKGNVVTIKRKSNKQMVIDVIDAKVFVLKPGGSNNNLHGEELPMRKLKATHSGRHYKHHPASYAIDGNPSTWFQASSSGAGTVGWWKVDTGRTNQILGVSITSPNNFYRSRDLHDFKVLVTNKLGKRAICYIYNKEPFEPGKTKYFACPKPLIGRSVTIQKLNTSYDRYAISLADVQIYVDLSNDPTNGRIKGSATALGFYRFNIPQFAIDGDMRTCAIACFPCFGKPSHGYEIGWWQYDLGRPMNISSVHILTCNTQQNANYLLDILIGISFSNVTNLNALTICNDDEDNRDKLPTSRWLNFKCSKGWLVEGRYLLIRRKTSAFYRPDVIALAEIKIEEQPGSFVNVTIKNRISTTFKHEILSRLAKKQWFKIPLMGSMTSQVGTFSNHVSSHAIDNDKNTFSMACNPCGSSKGLGWWKINLKTIFLIVAVEIISSPDEYYSNLLQEFYIKIGLGSLKDTICYQYEYPTYIPPLTTISLVCRKPLFGNTLRIKRKFRSSFRTDAISIAEISIYTSNKINPIERPKLWSIKPWFIKSYVKYDKMIR